MCLAGNKIRGMKNQVRFFHTLCIKRGRTNLRMIRVTLRLYLNGGLVQGDLISYWFFKKDSK